MAFAAILIKNHLAQAPASVEQAAPSNRIIVAKRDIAVGTFIQADQDLAWGEPPADADQPDSDQDSQTAPKPTPPPGSRNAEPPPPKPTFLRESAVRLSDFNGALARKDMRAGEPIMSNALMKSGEGGFMSAVLDPGMRAVSIAVTATSGNAGFVSPGDHVDLIVTHHVKTTNTPNGMDTVVSETFARDVRIVAIDQMLDNPDNKAILAKTITVEVSPRQAEQVAVAEEMGKISVALRSLTAKPDAPRPMAKKALTGDAKKLSDLYGAPDGGDAQDDHYTRDSDISQLLDRKSISTHVHVIRGDQSENLQF